jgi:hypothetical protein
MKDTLGKEFYESVDKTITIKRQQSAVEWLANELYEKFEMKGDGALFNDLLNQAKEMENKQQGYSEENMTEYAMYILKNNVITPKEWFKRFKSSTPWYDEDQTTERMNVIGQNGNDGEHY